MTECKRQITDFNTKWKLKDSDITKQVPAVNYSVWEKLPYLILVEIYRLLPAKDRFNLSLTCRAWSEPFSHPEVWRHAKFSFNVQEHIRARCFDKSLASELHHLEIDCRSSFEFQCLRDPTPFYSLSKFLCTLQSCKDCKLASLKLIEINDLLPKHERDRIWMIVKKIRDLLSTQSNLRVLDLSRAGLSSEQSIDILTQAALRSGSKLTILSFDNFCWGIDDDSIIRCFQAFRSLSELTLGYQYLSDGLLNVIAVSGSLKRLNVIVLQMFNYFFPIDSDAWENLKRSRPSLEARYYIEKKIQSVKDLKTILVAGIPLVALEFGCNCIGPTWNILCTHIANNFKDCLRYLSIEIMLDLECSMFGLLDTFLDCCYLLQEIHIKDDSRNSTLQVALTSSIQERMSSLTCIQLRKFTYNGLEVDLELVSSPTETVEAEEQGNYHFSIVKQYTELI